MASIKIEFNDEPGEVCSNRQCQMAGRVRVHQEHEDDGEAWTMCSFHAMEFVTRNIQWVLDDGEDPDRAECTR